VPAWPPPITITSNCSGNSIGSKLGKKREREYKFAMFHVKPDADVSRETSALAGHQTICGPASVAPQGFRGG
jgi:hypothetical protein